MRYLARFSPLCFLFLVMFSALDQARGTIDVVQTPGVTVDVTSVGLNRWNVVIDVASSTGSVQLRGEPLDVIALLEVQLDGSATTLNLFIEGANGQPGIAGIERINRVGESGDKLRITNLDILGDLGVLNPSTSMIINELTNGARIRGNWYADVRVLKLTPPQSLNVGNIQVDGDWIGGGLYTDTGNIQNIAILGDMLPGGVGFAPSEIWSIGSIASVTASSMTDTRIGDNTAGFSGKSDVGTINCLGDFTSQYFMQADTIGLFDIAGTSTPRSRSSAGLAPTIAS